MTSSDKDTSQDRMQRLVTLALERRAEDLAVLDVRELVDYMDFLVICSARSERQNRAIAEHVRRGLKKQGTLPLSHSGEDWGAWICVDYVDVVLHSFTPETRLLYDLELLWADAPKVELPAEVLAVRERELDIEPERGELALPEEA